MNREPSRNKEYAAKEFNRRDLLTRGTVGLAGAGIAMASGRAAAETEETNRQGSLHRIDMIAKPNTSGGPVDVKMPGNLGPQRKICGWPNVVEVANLALRHFNEICDPNYHYETCVVEGERLSGVCETRGTTTRLSTAGNLVKIMSFNVINEPVAPRIISVDEHNHFLEYL